MLFPNMKDGTRDKLNLLGVGLSQLAAGQPANLTNAKAALAQRQQRAAMQESLQSSGLLQKFTPEQRQMLSMMEPAAAQKIIAQALFAKPEPVKPIEVNGQLVDPTTGQVIGDYRTPDRGPAPTDDMREYAAAVEQGFQGTLQDWILSQREAGRSTTEINMGSEVGTIPPGYELYTDPETGARSMRPIPGGPVWQDMQEAEEEAAEAADQAADRDETTTRAANIVVQDIQRVRDMLNGGRNQPITGISGSVAALKPGSEAADARALVKTIKANIGFDRLQQMREQSPTGGALGNVTVQELETLQAVLGNLEFSQSKEQLIENLDRLEEVYVNILAKIEKTGDGSFFGGTDTSGTPPAPEGFTDDEWREFWQSMPEADRAAYREAG